MGQLLLITIGFLGVAFLLYAGINWLCENVALKKAEKPKHTCCNNKHNKEKE